MTYHGILAKNCKHAKEYVCRRPNIQADPKQANIGWVLYPILDETKRKGHCFVVQVISGPGNTTAAIRIIRGRTLAKPSSLLSLI
jgi:hypothetical protein